MSAYEATYCPRCGTKTETKHVDGRDRTWCPECDVVHWRAAVPVVGVAVVDDDRVLTILHGPSGKYDFPSGHPETPEPPADAAVRELEEEANLVVDPADVELFDITVKHHPLGRYNFSTTYVAPAEAASGTPRAATDAEAVEWFTPDEARARSDEFIEAVPAVLERAVEHFR